MPRKFDNFKVIHFNTIISRCFIEPIGRSGRQIWLGKETLEIRDIEIKSQ